jgi:carbon monoxide dehydrogenase subunit G
VKLDQSFEVNAPLQAVWEALVDVERVAPCLPGAEITEGGDDGQYKGTFTVKLGPTTAAYRGTLKMESADQASHTAVMRANGTDKRGQGGAKAQITSVVSEAEGGATRVDVSTDFTITGRLARFGRGGMIQDVSNRLLREFAECLQRNLEPEDGPAVTAEAAPGEPAPFAPASGEKPPAFAPAGGGKPVSGLRLFFGALVDRLRRVFQRRRST